MRNLLSGFWSLVAAVVMMAATSSAFAAADCTVNSPVVDITGINTSALSVAEPLIMYGGTYGAGYAYKAAVTVSITCGSALSAWSLTEPGGFMGVQGSYFVLVDPVTQLVVCASGCGAWGVAVTGTGSTSLNLEVWCTGSGSLYPRCLEGPVFSGGGSAGMPLTLTSPGGTSGGAYSFGGVRAFSCTLDSPHYNIGSVDFSNASVIESTSASASTKVYKVPVSLTVTCDSTPPIFIYGPSTPVSVTVGASGTGQAMLYQASQKRVLTVSSQYYPGNTSYGSRSWSDFEIWLSGAAAGQVFGAGSSGAFSAVVPITLSY